MGTHAWTLSPEINKPVVVISTTKENTIPIFYACELP